MKKFKCTSLCIAVITILITCCVLGGCGRNAHEPDFSSPTEADPSSFAVGQRLRISASADANSTFTRILQEDLGGNSAEDITYHQLTNVTIEIDGTPVKLEEAIRDGFITTSEITAYAQLDAQNGFCDETYSSQRGLSSFVYTYPEFELEVVHDIYETPDEKQHLIQSMKFYPPHGSEKVSTAYYDENSQFGYTIDREDWGIEFSVSQATPTSITLDYTQSGGQQIGELVVTDDYVMIAEDGTYVEQLNTADQTPANDRPPIAAIRSDATSQITIDWEAKYGPLPSGEYCMMIFLKDVYDESQVHPLMINFTDNQKYGIIFTIP